jgi:hypothetical protein
MRKGVSAMIATVLLIALSLIIGGIILLNSQSLFVGLAPQVSCPNQPDVQLIYFGQAAPPKVHLEVSNPSNYNIMKLILQFLDISNDEVNSIELQVRIFPGGSLRKDLTSEIVEAGLDPALISDYIVNTEVYVEINSETRKCSGGSKETGTSQSQESSVRVTADPTTDPPDESESVP